MESLVTDPEAAGSPFDVESTHIIEPRHLALRIRSQSAAFTVHGLGKTQQRFLPLDQKRALNGMLEKLVIPTQDFSGIRYDLHLCGIHAASVFPDLDGISRRIEWSHTFYSDEEFIF